MDLAALRDRDGELCWICGAGVDEHLPRLDPGAGSVDHVIPRHLGGGDEEANLRLAHRRCNSRRGARLPELDWPAALPLSAPAELWGAVSRALRRPGSSELVAAGDLATLTAARSWLEHTLTELLPGVGFDVEIYQRTPVTLILRAHPTELRLKNAQRPRSRRR